MATMTHNADLLRILINLSFQLIPMIAQEEKFPQNSVTNTTNASYQPVVFGSLKWKFIYKIICVRNADFFFQFIYFQLYSVISFSILLSLFCKITSIIMIFFVIFVCLLAVSVTIFPKFYLTLSVLLLPFRVLNFTYISL